MNIMNPILDPNKLSLKDKIELIGESDRLLIDILEGEEIKGNLYLEGCSFLTHLPNDLEVEGSLDLRGCSSLTHLPDKLKKVDGYLYLEGCSSLTHLPNDLEVEGKKNLSMNIIDPAPDPIQIFRI